MQFDPRPYYAAISPSDPESPVYGIGISPIIAIDEAVRGSNGGHSHDDFEAVRATKRLHDKVEAGGGDVRTAWVNGVLDVSPVSDAEHEAFEAALDDETLARASQRAGEEAEDEDGVSDAKERRRGQAASGIAC